MKFAREITNRPFEVKYATRFLWIGLAIEIIQFIFHIANTAHGDSDLSGFTVVIVTPIVFVVGAFLIFQVWVGKRWALVLIVTLIVVVGTMSLLEKFQGKGINPEFVAPELVLEGAVATINYLAAWLLCMEPSRRWFFQRSEAIAADL
jgi:hypothetical protein